MTDNSVAIVTGAAQGLGAAITRALLRQGYKVCVTDVQETKGKSFVQELQKEFGPGAVIFSLCDVTKEEDLKRTFDLTVGTFKTVNLLVNNAGIVWEQNPRKTIDVNLMGPIFGCQLALKYMGKTNGGKGGVVINIASTGGFLPAAALPCYHASKHAIIGLTRSYGLPYHLERDGVLFGAVCPHFIDTDILRNPKTLVEGLDVVTNNQSMMSPDYVAQGVLKILEDRISGGTLVVSKEKGYQYIGTQKELDDFTCTVKPL
ncbi:15-hydroxyprostaglandin dehydrogenase [NAD(+)]-like [Uloborus diversus]|uniref:15-hydroxyprostaglandin dehydrogenase [NAD(+)]-like n=1 Tax=Uloborus diversus TaxID=327109 RepID=UPI002409B3EC|nr:15-hydroxyprostaglandin dehydrogenase [NAD(+)]-like [Uloborus diversus]